MDKCTRLAEILDGLHLDLEAGGYRPKIGEQLDQLGDVRDCITDGLRRSADESDWQRFYLYVLAASHQSDRSMTPILCDVLDQWREIAHQPDGINNIDDIVWVLDGLRDPAAVGCLERAIGNEPDWDEYHHFARQCIWALTKIGTPEASDALQRVAQGKIPEIRQEALDALNPSTDRP